MHTLPGHLHLWVVVVDAIKVFSSKTVPLVALDGREHAPPGLALNWSTVIILGSSSVVGILVHRRPPSPRPVAGCGWFRWCCCDNPVIQNQFGCSPALILNSLDWLSITTEFCICCRSTLHHHLDTNTTPTDRQPQPPPHGRRTVGNQQQDEHHPL